MGIYYKLDGDKIIPTNNLVEWAKWFETANRRIDYTELPDGKRVSTIFLGIDHNFGKGVPLLFETIVFASRDAPKTSFNDLDISRYSTKSKALLGHSDMVKKWTTLKHKIPLTPKQEIVYQFLNQNFKKGIFPSLTKINKYLK